MVKTVQSVTGAYIISPTAESLKTSTQAGQGQSVLARKQRQMDQINAAQMQKQITEARAAASSALNRAVSQQALPVQQYGSLYMDLTVTNPKILAVPYGFPVVVSPVSVLVDNRTPVTMITQGQNRWQGAMSAIPVGKHTITAKYTGMTSKQVTITVLPNQVTRVSIGLP
jgi:hypothetical protein